MRPDVKINDLWMFAIGWLREEIDFPTPQSQTNTVVVPGRNAPIRFTEALGWVSYQPRSFSITLAVTLRFLPALRQDLRHIWDAMNLRNIRGFEEKLECIYVPMLMGAAQTAEELSESATARGIEFPGKMSSWRPIGFHIQDVVVTLLFLALCVGGICCKGVLP